jgi:hypothetical protein
LGIKKEGAGMRWISAISLIGVLFAFTLTSPGLGFADQSGRGGRGNQDKAQAVRVEKQLADEVNRAQAVTPPRVNVRQAPATVSPNAVQNNTGRTEIETEMEILNLL